MTDAAPKPASLAAEDVVSERLMAEFSATLAPWLFAVPGDEAPPGLHWCLAPPLAATGQLGADGHPPRLHDVPVAEFPRRMWVGGSVELLAPLRRGQRVTRVTTLAPIEMKSGGSGQWCLTGADHRFAADGVLAIAEHQDIAFRPAAGSAAGSGVARAAGGALPEGDLVWEIETSPTLLFRYSALTFNSHRIHYDQPYATGVEGYGGLVVHGPLQATVLLNLAATLLGQVPRRFVYRATAPLIGGGVMLAIGRREGDGVTASVCAADGTETLRATAA